MRRKGEGGEKGGRTEEKEEKRSKGKKRRKMKKEREEEASDLKNEDGKKPSESGKKRKEKNPTATRGGQTDLLALLDLLQLGGGSRDGSDLRDGVPGWVIMKPTLHTKNGCLTTTFSWRSSISRAFCAAKQQVQHQHAMQSMQVSIWETKKNHPAVSCMIRRRRC